MLNVSVILPTYNRSRLLIKAAQSVLDQNFSDFELIVIDDGSTDDTSKIIQSMDDKRIKYFYKKNGGVSSARNLGIKKSNGKFIAFLDSDDLWPKEYLKVMTAALDKYPEYGLAYSLFRDYYSDGKIKDGFKKDRFMSGHLVLEYYKKSPCFLPSSTLIKKQLSEQVWFDEALKNYDDQDFFLRLSAITKFLFVDNICIKRRITEGSLSDKKFNYNPALVFERFYNHLGGKDIIPESVYRKKMSEHYRGLARRHYNEKHRKASVELYKKAVRFHPYCFKNYRWLLKALLLRSKNDRMPHWLMLEPLPNYITANEKTVLKMNCRKSGCSES